MSHLAVIITLSHLEDALTKLGEDILFMGGYSLRP